MSEAESPSLFSPADHARVTAAVAAAENLTAAELVPVVAAESGRYDRAEDLVGLLTGIAAMTAVWFAWPASSAGVVEPPSSWQWLALVAATMIGFVGGTWLAARWTIVRAMFTPRGEMADDVDDRARAIFFDQRIRQTAQRTGLLFFVSLYERRAVVLADEAVVAALGEAGVEQLCGELTARLAASGPIAALCETIAIAGERLAQALPRASDDRNELSDALIELD